MFVSISAGSSPDHISFFSLSGREFVCVHNIFLVHFLSLGYILNAVVINVHKKKASATIQQLILLVWSTDIGHNRRSTISIKEYIASCAKMLRLAQCYGAISFSLV